MSSTEQPITHATRRNQKIILQFGGRTASLREWARLTGKSYHTLYSRFQINPDPVHVFKGINVDEAVPVAQTGENAATSV